MSKVPLYFKSVLEPASRLTKSSDEDEHLLAVGRGGGPPLGRLPGEYPLPVQPPAQVYWILIQVYWIHTQVYWTHVTLTPRPSTLHQVAELLEGSDTLLADDPTQRGEAILGCTNIRVGS